MNGRRAALIWFALAQALAADSWSADPERRAAQAAVGNESIGMYSNYADQGSVASRKYLGNAGAEVLSESELMPALVSALYQLSKYHRPVALPRVIRVSHARIESIVCTGACAALAVYRPGEGIYLDERLKPETDLFDRSILLHELVHYVQDMSDEHGDMKPCRRWYHREQEAYAIQKNFLGMTGSPTRVGYSAHKSTCDD